MSYYVDIPNPKGGEWQNVAVVATRAEAEALLLDGDWKEAQRG